MKCPACGHIESKVIDSRASDEGKSIKRRRECLACQRRFNTYEVVENCLVKKFCFLEASSSEATAGTSTTSSAF